MPELVGKPGTMCAKHLFWLRLEGELATPDDHISQQTADKDSYLASARMCLMLMARYVPLPKQTCTTTATSATTTPHT